MEQPPELIRIATGAGHVCNPHDPEAEFANKGKKGWLGYKVAETVCNEGQNFITHIDLESATNFDGDCVQGVVAGLEEKGFPPSELYGDTHYNTSANIESLAGRGIDLKGPVMPATKSKTEKDIGFAVLLDEQKVICPQGVESKHFHIDPRKKLSASFPQQTCAICPRRETCKPNPRGKIYEQKVENKTINERREKLNDPAYKKDLSLKLNSMRVKSG